MSGRHPHASHVQGHTHGLVDHSVLRSRAGVRAVLVSLLLLGATAAAQAVVYVLTGSVALLADLIHNAGDALTAVPVGAAFLLASPFGKPSSAYSTGKSSTTSGRSPLPVLSALSETNLPPRYGSAQAAVSRAPP